MGKEAQGSKCQDIGIKRINIRLSTESAYKYPYMYNTPASILTLAQHWHNVSEGWTDVSCQHWHNVVLAGGIPAEPTSACQHWPNIGPTLCQPSWFRQYIVLARGIQFLCILYYAHWVSLHMWLILLQTWLSTILFGTAISVFAFHLNISFKGQEVIESHPIL